MAGVSCLRAPLPGKWPHDRDPDGTIERGKTTMPVSTQRKRSLLASIRSWAALAIMFGMVAMVLAFLDRLQPVRQWMFWRYSMIGGYAILFGIASFSIGHTAVGLMARGIALPLRERLLFDGAVGVLLFALGVLLAGLCGGLGGVF